jgi:dUTP pyrophosphatase
MVALHNHSNQPQTIEPKERVAQLAIVPFLRPDFQVADTLDDTARGTGGFGSTGTK